MNTESSHRVGQVWHPIKTDRRYRISLAFYGYSVPMYGCYFCDDLIACCPSLGRAIHACETLREERELRWLTTESFASVHQRLGGPTFLEFLHSRAHESGAAD